MPTADFSSYHQPSGTVADGTKFDNFIDDVQATVNGLDDDNVAAAAGILLSKLGQSGAAVGQGVFWNGTSWVPGSSALYKKTTSKTVNNTVTETDLLNGEITIAAGVLGTTGMLRLRTFIDGLASSGVAATWRFKVKLGGTVVFDSAAISVPNQGTRFGLVLDFEMLNTGAANSNVCRARLALPAVALANTAVIGATSPTDIGTGEKWTIIEGAGASAIDTSTSQALTVTVTHGTAASTIETKLYGASVEVL